MRGRHVPGGRSGPVITSSVERWADEDAAAAVRDRPLVARTLARSALAGATVEVGHHADEFFDHAHIRMDATHFQHGHPGRTSH
jgi:hypothetical protein